MRKSQAEMTSSVVGRELEIVSRPSDFVRLTTVGMIVDRPLTLEEWADIGPGIGKGQRAFAWSAGDWLAYGEHNFPDKYSQAMDATDLSLGRLRNLKSMCDRVPQHVRNPNLSLSHHESVASFTPAYQKQLLDLAEKFTIDRDTFRQLIADIKDGAQIPDGNGDQLVVNPPKVSKDDIVEQARHVAFAWRNNYSNNTVSMTLHESLEKLAELIGENG